MKIKKSIPFGMASSETFIAMGIISDSGKEYLCFIDMDKAKKAMETHKKHTTLTIMSECCYIEEIHYTGRNKTLETASLHQVDNDNEWATLVKFVMTKTDIFSPKKIRNIMKHGIYFYSDHYLMCPGCDKCGGTTKDAEHRIQEGII